MINITQPTTIRAGIGGCIAALLPLLAYATVEITLDKTVITQNQPLNLTISIVSTADAVPDLNNLDQDFLIRHQRVSYSTQTFNGQTRQHTILQLVLFAKRSGDLTIPPIKIGTETSNPLAVQVTPETLSTAQPYVPQPQYYPPPSMAEWSVPPNRNDQDTNLQWNSRPSNNDPTTITLPKAGTNTRVDLNAADSTTPVPTAAPTNGAAYSTANCALWHWLTGVMALAWLATIVTVWRQGRYLPGVNAQATPGALLPVSTILPLTTSPVPKSVLINQIQQAYENADPLAAKVAMLQWAAQVWPENPPTNLSSLAARCDAELQYALLKLDQAIYSSKPTRWHEQKIWEWLATK